MLHRTVAAPPTGIYGYQIESEYPVPSSAAVSAVMRGNRKKDTKPEVRLRSALHALGMRFRKDFAIRPDSGRGIRVDVAFPKQRLAVFVDGCFWHSCPQHGTMPSSNVGYWLPKLRRNVDRDHETDTRLTGAGWQVVRVWEHEPVAAAAGAIRSLLDRIQ
jgi:DNA mismatch endonuclease (patch repair protein)